MELADSASLIRVSQKLRYVRAGCEQSFKHACVVLEFMRLRRAPLEREQHQHEDDDQAVEHFDALYEQKMSGRPEALRTFAHRNGTSPHGSDGFPFNIRAAEARTVRGCRRWVIHCVAIGREALLLRLHGSIALGYDVGSFVVQDAMRRVLGDTLFAAARMEFASSQSNGGSAKDCSSETGRDEESADLGHDFFPFGFTCSFGEGPDNVSRWKNFKKPVH